MNLSDLFQTEKLQIAITRIALFSLKCTRNRLATGLRPDPLGELKRAPPGLLATARS